MTWDEISAAIERARWNVGYEPFDQDKHLPDHEPPWTQDEVAEWEKVHGHDFRMKCYPEYGCQVIESAANNAHLDSLAAIHALHHPTTCEAECANPCYHEQVVIDALTRMEVLTDGD